MSEISGLPPRPDPPRRMRDTFTAWLSWFGPVRLIAGAVSVAAVAAGGYWLVRSPVPPPEAGLPVAVPGAVRAACNVPSPATLTLQHISTSRAGT